MGSYIEKNYTLFGNNKGKYDAVGRCDRGWVFSREPALQLMESERWMSRVYFKEPENLLIAFHKVRMSFQKSLLPLQVGVGEYQLVHPVLYA